ncbi:unnamed protein product, partial [Ilex paraguariensis]
VTHVIVVALELFVWVFEVLNVQSEIQVGKSQLNSSWKSRGCLNKRSHKIENAKKTVQPVDKSMAGH